MTILIGIIPGSKAPTALSPLEELSKMVDTILARESRGFPWSYTTGSLRARLPVAITRIEQNYDTSQLAMEYEALLITARAMANGKS